MNPNMIFWVSLVALLVGGAGLGALAGTLVAQRQEKRFEQGYDAGVEAGRRLPPSPQPPPVGAHRDRRPPEPMGSTVGRLTRAWNEAVPPPGQARWDKRPDDTMDRLGEGYQAGFAAGQAARPPWVNHVRPPTEVMHGQGGWVSGPSADPGPQYPAPVPGASEPPAAGRGA